MSVHDLADIARVCGVIISGRRRAPGITKMTSEDVDRNKDLFDMVEVGVLLGFARKNAAAKALAQLKPTGLLTKIGRRWYVRKQALRRELWDELDNMGLE